ncbi:2,3-bisphosphoglycerate-independent phosphoglycerate mutase, partial [Pseudomonadota bacterium]
MTDKPTRKPLLLMILDGWGYRPERDDNAIALAATPCWDELWRNDPHSLIETSGSVVGLPEGQMGNSEVGHMNIGAGRIVFQDYSRIENAIRDGSFRDNPQIRTAVEAALKAGGRVHVMGLLSPGGVHSHDDHFIETVRVVAQHGARGITVHAFLDGRDTPPRSAEPSIRCMQELLDSLPGACFGTIGGRYYAMDRDKRWD